MSPPDRRATEVRGELDAKLDVDGARDHGEYSLVRVVGEVGMEIATGLRMIAFALRRMPRWEDPEDHP
jgi:hypothetical protein